MRITVPQVTCDHCGVSLDVTTRSTEVVIRWPDGTGATFLGENCANCLRDLQEEMDSHLHRYLAPAESAPKQHRKRATSSTINPPDPATTRARITGALDERTCPICRDDPGLPDYVGPTRSAFSQHVSQKHKTTLGKLGLTLPLTR